LGVHRGQTVAFFLAYDVATFSWTLTHYGVIHTNFGLRFSLADGTFTDATVNDASVLDYHDDAIWSSRFNLGDRMLLR
jgi:hypothetical protein